MKKKPMEQRPEEMNRTYIAIDLKSFYASVECRERGRDPLTTHLVVADASRTEKTICLAVSPSLKAYGISGRARLFEVVQRMREVNAQRLAGLVKLRTADRIPPEAGTRDPAALSRQGGKAEEGDQIPKDGFRSGSDDAVRLASEPDLKAEYIIAPPRMALYMQYSTRIYQIYLQYVAAEDIHVYSIDEVFIDVTDYLKSAGMTARQMAMKMILHVLSETGITATAGIGTNLYLAKIAMDIDAKHIPADENGVRISELDERSYRQRLWTHEPITDFWRVGKGYARKLHQHGLYTMGDIARCSLGKATDFYNEDLLYQLFGVNAELLIDHAWGHEPCRIADIKGYRPQSNSISSGQVLQEPYPADRARIVVREMSESLVLDLVRKGLTTDQMVLTVGYDIENLTDPRKRRKYRGPVTTDWYGRKIPKHAHGTANLPERTSSSALICREVMKLYDRIVDPELLVRRMYIYACRLENADQTRRHAKADAAQGEQMDMFTDYEIRDQQEQKHEADVEKEHRMQEAILAIKEKYGKNAVLTGISLEEGATARDRNQQIGGHKA